jgi:hypothetical protein
MPLANTPGQQSVPGTKNSKTQAVPSGSSRETGLWSKSRPESHRQLRADDVLNAEKIASLEIAQPNLVPPPAPRHQVADDMAFRQRESEASFRDLRERIIRLQKRLQLQLQPSAAQQQPKPPVPEPAATTPSDAVPIEESGVPPVTEPTDEGDASAIPLSVPPPPGVAEAPKDTATASVFADSMIAKAIVDGPVDRIGLADSLYALNELPIALEMYEKVDVKHVAPSERFWVSFQRACCLRKLKRIPEAQELYRRLAGQESAGWLAEVSRWWLDQIDARVELETHIKEYDAILTALKEWSDDRNGE